MYKMGPGRDVAENGGVRSTKCIVGKKLDIPCERGDEILTDNEFSRGHKRLPIRGGEGYAPRRHNRAIFHAQILGGALVS